MDQRPEAKDIAIIGMSCRVAGANSPGELWDILASSRDVQSDISRFNAQGFYHPKGGSLKGLTNVKSAYMLDNDLVDRFDNNFFLVPQDEAAAIDPQQRMLLEIAYEAVESAGIPLDDFVGSDTGVYAGMEGSDYHTILARDLDATPKYLATGTAGSFAANRISYFFNLSGPSFVIDSACSSSMSALHQAVTALKLSECSMALVCGAKLILNPDMFMPSTELGFLSPDGRCKTFDAAADGYGRGEGVLALLIRPLDDAIRCNDPIRAVIKGTRLNQDGRTQGITLPSAIAQQNNMRSLYERLDLSPDDIQYLEAHGTGTSAGDSLETSAINAVFHNPKRTDDLIVGSIKSNIGHLESCSALAAIIKTVLGMEHAQIPPQMNLRDLNPYIDFSRLKIPTQMLSWPASKTGTRLAAVNSFGAGGTNGHAVLQSYNPPLHYKHADLVRPLLFKVTAHTESTLHRMKGFLAAYCETKQPDLQRLAYTLGSRRSAMAKTMFFTAQNNQGLVSCLKSQSTKSFGKPSTASPAVVLLFTGQGAQWPCMGKELLIASPLFHSVVVECQKVLDSLPDGPEWCIINELSKTAETSNVYKSAYSQPLCTILQLGLVELLRFWKVTPFAVVGHSSGEIAAAYAAGMISLRDAVVVAYYRGRYLSDLATRGVDGKPRGSMCAISVSHEKAKAMVSAYADRVQIAALNSPGNCTLSGDTLAIQSIIQNAKEMGIFCRELRVDTAFHSSHVLPVVRDYTEALQAAGVSFNDAAKCCMFSTVSGDLITSEDCTPEYWARNMAMTVQFAPALLKCLQSVESAPICLEIGPHPALKAPACETGRTVGIDLAEYHASCIRGQNASISLIESASSMLAVGVKLDLAAVNNIQETANATLPRVLSDLPPYPFDHSNVFWYETGVSKSVRFRQHRRHLLLGSRGLDDSSLSPCWRNHLRLDEVPLLKKVQAEKSALDVRVALYIVMVMEAAKQMQIDYYPRASWRISEVKPLETSLISALLASEQQVNLHSNFHGVGDGGEFHFQILALGPQHNRECSGRLQFDKDAHPCPGTSEAVSHDDDLQRAFEWLGFDTSVPSILKDVKVSNAGCEGYFDCIDQSNTNTFLELEVLHAVLCLIPRSTSNSLLPGNPKVVSVQSISSCQRPVEFSAGCFSVCTKILNDTSSSSNVHLFSNSHSIVIEALVIRIDRYEVAQAPLRTLFSVPKLLPDISSFYGTRMDSLQHLIDLLMHKWPMADILIAGISDEQSLRELITMFTHQRRASCRSVYVRHSQLSDISNSKVRFVEDLKSASHVHLLLIGGESVLDVKSTLHPRGFVCAPAGNKIRDPFQAFAKFTSSDETNWIAYRQLNCTDPDPFSSNSVIFTDRPLSAYGNPQTEYRSVPLSPSMTAQFCAESLLDKYPAVVIESSEKSVITSWAGKDIVPWLQHMTRWATRIIWVSRSRPSNPFHGTAGILLRSLQAEQPALKVTWIKCGESEDDVSIMEKVQRAYASFAQDENEIKHDYLSSSPEIVRYVPDDELSTLIGLTPPLTTDIAYQKDPNNKTELIRYERKACLFDASGTYVIIGGLGGLGRFVCLWMASRGARKLAIISRSGTRSIEAQQSVDELRKVGVFIQVIQADARDRSAISAALAEIREHSPIRGTINMAMVLADVPFAEMTSAQWDMALRIKVDSSWILHQETMVDKLDFFILFSSIASVLGNRNQTNYNVGNGFLNALAEYRHSLGLPAISVALGAMTEIGVLHEAGIADLLRYLSRSALTALNQHDLGKILEAAVIESPRRERPIILTGLEMFEKVNGKIIGSQDQSQVIWTDFPELGHLQDHKLVEEGSDSVGRVSLRQKLASANDSDSKVSTILDAFLAFFADLQGFDTSSIDHEGSIWSYGLDSLGAVSCQFWFHRELGVDISAGEVSNTRSLAGLAKLASERLDQ